MSRARLGAALALLLVLVAGGQRGPVAAVAGAETACPPPSATLLFHSCWGRARAALLLLPDDLPLPPPPADGRRLVVTGAYTSRETRGNGMPKPVGLFVAGGRVVNRNLGRMDGVLVIAPNGEPRLFHRRAVRLGGIVYDLTRPRLRHAFTDAAARAGVSVMQSHLLIADGAIDVRESEGAPQHLRRLLFFGAGGWGVYQTARRATLHEAAREIAGTLAPEAALNLDMGSYDFCRLAVEGREADCGLVAGEGLARLSNLLMLTAE